MRYAITPQGIGKKPGARAIEDHFLPAPGETFSVPESAYSPAFVLAEDSLSLRAKTQGEIDAETAAVVAAGVEQAAVATLEADAKADAVFDTLKTATAAQISTFVNNQFSGFTAPQRATMKLLIHVAALVLRRLA